MHGVSHDIRPCLENHQEEHQQVRAETVERWWYTVKSIAVVWRQGKFLKSLEWSLSMYLWQVHRAEEWDTQSKLAEIPVKRVTLSDKEKLRLKVGECVQAARFWKTAWNMQKKDFRCGEILQITSQNTKKETEIANQLYLVSYYMQKNIR